MITPPTTVHAAADYHRQALLIEAVEDWRTASTSVRSKRNGPCMVCFRIVAKIAAIVSRVIDDFEPAPGPLSPRTNHLDGSHVTASLAQRN